MFNGFTAITPPSGGWLVVIFSASLVIVTLTGLDLLDLLTLFSASDVIIIIIIIIIIIPTRQYYLE
jgi:hypothetical protein